MLKPKQQLGKFEVIELIGKGGMADVYLAEDLSLNRQVAIKVLPRRMAKDQDWIARFKHEVLSTAKLHHPHIVTVFEVGEHDEHHFYVMEYLSGGDLKQKIQTNLNVHQSLIYLKQIAQSLEYAHSKGFIHRDIKPENILFDENGVAKLTDLGIAKAVNMKVSLTGSRESIGTPLYISPEQAQGLDIDGRSDLYSLGVVFYEMITGRLPFYADSAVELAIAHINQPIPDLPPNYAEYQDFLNGMMAKAKEDRFDSASDLIEAIELLQINKPFVLTDYYQSRLESSPLKHNFGSILDDVEEGYSEKSFAMKWLLIALFLMIGVGFWQQEFLVKAANQLTDWFKSQTQTNVADAQSPRGVIRLESTPSGASVFLNGTEVGTTPYLGQAIPEGTHSLKIISPLHEELRIDIEVKKDQISEYHFSLQTGHSTINIDSVPSGASILIDGVNINKKTPIQLTDVVAGEHEIFLFKGHLAAKVNLNAFHKQETTIKPSLTSGLMAFYPNDWVAITQLYQLAEQLITEVKLSAPSGNNAEEVYMAILKANPKEQDAKEKLNQLGEQHWQLAKQYAEQKQPIETEYHIKSARRLLKQSFSEPEAKQLIKQSNSK